MRDKKVSTRALIEARHEKALARIRGPKTKYVIAIETGLLFLWSLTTQLSKTLAATTLRALAEWVDKKKDSQIEAMFQAKPTGLSAAEQQRLYHQNVPAYPPSNVPRYESYSNQTFQFDRTK